MQPENLDGEPPFVVAMHINVRFTQVVSDAANMDAATQLVRSKAELFVNRARAEAEQHGIEMKCDYLVTYPSC